MSVAHPARYSDALVPVLAEHLQSGWLVLDPFAGTGRIHEIAAMVGTESVGVELEPEWAGLHPRTVVGDATALPFGDATFDAVMTSPTYGNRMADHHNARDNTRRITYRHTLGRPLHPNNSGQLQWGPKYRTFHWRAWLEATRALREGGFFVLNCSDHIRGGKVQGVTDWHVVILQSLGYEVTQERQVPTPRMGFGQNGGTRVDHESVVVLRKSSRPR